MENLKEIRMNEIDCLRVTLLDPQVPVSFQPSSYNFEGYLRRFPFELQYLPGILQLPNYSVFAHIDLNHFLDEFHKSVLAL